MIAVVEHFDALRPLVLREVVQPVDGRAEGPVGQEAQNPGHDDRILKPACGDVGLADDGKLGIRPSLEQPLHGGEGDRLVPGQHLPGGVTGRKGHQNARDQSPDDPRRRQMAACRECSPKSAQ